MTRPDEIDLDKARAKSREVTLERIIRFARENDLENGPPYQRPKNSEITMENHWREMKEAEWRGKAGEKLDRLESMLTAMCAKVDAHDKTLAVLEDRGIRTSIGWRGWAAIISAVIISLGSIAVAYLN